MTPRSERRVSIGRVAGLFGVRGWVKVHSYTRPREAILNYKPWLIEHDGEWREIGVTDGRAHGRGIVAQLAGCTDRDATAPLVGAEIAVLVSQLPEAGKNEYYWVELEGMRVVNLDGEELGQVTSLFETGANDVMVVRGERERLIPFGRGVVQRVDRNGGVVYVDWDADD